MEAVSAAPVVIRPDHIQDIFVRGVLDIEDLGDCARVILYVEREPIEQGPVEHYVRAQIVMQWEDMPAAIRMSATFFMRWLKTRARIPLLRLLH